MSAQILPFTPKAATPRRTGANDAVPLVVIFPGVRYERLPEPEARPAGAQAH